MGLDMYIYSAPREEYETIKKQIKDIESVIEKEENNFNLTENRLLIEKLEVFRDKYKDILPEQDGMEPIINYLVSLIDTFAYGGYTIEAMTWEMFEYFSRFEVRGVLGPIPNQNEVATDFFTILQDFMRPDTLQDKVNKHRKLIKRQQKLLTEECYWRSFRDLNTYMCTNLGADNCELTEICKDDVEILLSICRDSSVDPQQLVNLLSRWDNSRVYYYYPWW